MRVLLVDDSGTVLGMMKALLEQMGHTVAVAKDGDAGLEVIADFEPDVVVCDLKMPRMNGLQVVRAVRDRSATLPVIIFTDEADVPRAVEAMKEGAYSYVVKGSPVERLAEEIEAAFAQKNRLERARALEREREKEKLRS
ncbi:MAG: response regulator [Myxococcaceae bacterium]|nr:response regulator [Myxococcaceae bacterium]